jgi:hypothetical protein
MIVPSSVPQSSRRPPQLSPTLIALRDPLGRVQVGLAVAVAVMSVFAGLATWDLWRHHQPSGDPSAPWQAGGLPTALAFTAILLLAWLVLAVYRRFVLLDDIGAAAWWSAAGVSVMVVALMIVVPIATWDVVVTRIGTRPDDIVGLRGVWGSGVEAVIAAGRTLTAVQAEVATLLLVSLIFGLIATSVSLVEGTLRARSRRLR